jgi:hypothetical protein
MLVCVAEEEMQHEHGHEHLSMAAGDVKGFAE